MARNTVIVSVLGDTRDLQKKLGDSEGSLGKFGKAAAVMGLAIGAAVAVVGAQAFKAVAEIERLNAQTAAALASTGSASKRSIEQINAQSDALEKLSGIEAEVIQNGQNILLTFTQIKGDNFDAATAAALDLSVALGQDMKSASTLVGKALNDPIAGMGALSRVGVQLTAEQKAVVEQMVAVGDVAGAQGVILGVLTEQFGGSAEAFGGTYLGALEKVKNSFGTLTEALVVGLLPGATATLIAINDLFVRIADSPGFQAFTESVGVFIAALFAGESALQNMNFSDVFASLLPGVIAGVAAAAAWVNGDGLTTLLASITEGRGVILDGAVQLFTTLAEALPQILPAVIAALTGFLVAMVGQLSTFLPPLLVAGLAMFQGLVQAIVVMAPQIIGQLAGLLPELLASILGMIPQLLQAAIGLFTMLVDAIPIILPPLIAIIIGLLPVLVASVLSMLPDILAAAINLFTSLVAAIPVILPLLLRAIIYLLPSLIGSVLSMLPALLRGAVQLFTGLVSAIPQIIPPLLGALIALAPVIIGAIIGLIPVLLRAGVDLIGGLVSGLFKAAGSVGKALLDIAKGAVGGFLKFLGIKSPSRLFASFGKDTVAGLAVGLRKNAGLVDGAMDQLSDRVAGGFSAQLSAPEIDGAFNTYSTGRSSSSMSATPATIQINLQTLNPTAETGRIIVESIRDYEFSGGRL
jgi:hypothetical protein